MKQIDSSQFNDAGVAKAIGVLAGELLECYQWNEDLIDHQRCRSAIMQMKVLLEDLDQRLIP